MEAINEALGKGFVKVLPLQNVMIYALVILLFIYHLVFDVDLPCTCENRITDCTVYMLLPVLIILFAQLCVDNQFLKCCSCTVPSCYIALGHFCKALFVSLLWVVLILVDGEWMLCCEDNSKNNVTCENDFNLTDQHHRDVIEWMNYSKTIGVSLLLAMLFVVLLVKLSLVRCPKNKWKNVILENEDTVLNEEMVKWAQEQMKERLQQHIEDATWNQSFHVADEVMTYIDNPGQRLLDSSPN